MKIEKKGIICGAIWGLTSIKLAMLGYTGYIYKILICYGINSNLLKLFEYTIYLPVNIVSFFGTLIFGNFPRELLVFAFIFYIIGTIFTGAFIGYLFAKIVKRYREYKDK